MRSCRTIGGILAPFVAVAPLTLFACGEARPDRDVRVLPASGVTLGQVSIEYIAHAAFRIHSPEGTQIIIDPYANQVWLGYGFPDSLDADAILITHPHYDHDAGDRMGRPFPWGERVEVIRDPGSYTVGDITIRGIRGKHADPYGKEFGQINTLFVLEVAGLRIAHLGDNGPLTESNVQELGRVDILMMPADAEYHILSAADTEATLTAVQPRVLIPMHYQHPDLETSPDKPDDLGPIDPWLEGRPNVQRLGSHIKVFSAGTLPQQDVIVVFPHSPDVISP